jgi:hypothetical protein
MKKPRPILAMNPQVMKAQVTMEEMPIPQQVEWYLKRIRHTLPFPCSIEDMYFGLVPPAVKKWHDEGVFEASDGQLPGRTSNLLQTMFATSDTNVRGLARANILHVSADPPEVYLEAQRGNRGCEEIFWVRTPWHVPLPRNSMQTPFFLAEDHPFYCEIKKWLLEATAIEQELQTSLELTTRYAQIVETYTQVYNTWPELLSFVRFKNKTRAPSRQVSQVLRERAAKAMRPTDKEVLITQLARATMLPESPPPLDAWVKFFTAEIGT